MTTFSDQIAAAALSALKTLFPEADLGNKGGYPFQINETKPEFTGDYTIVLFGLLKPLKQKPEDLGERLGAQMLQENPSLISGYNLIKGFLNIELTENALLSFLSKNFNKTSFETQSDHPQKIMVEYASPNTNKPLHLGHLRNIFLGWSVAEILKATGNEVVKTSIVNDRGIHICKSMIAWQEFANGATPESAQQKGDHLVGDYYVKFNDEYKKQVDQLMAEGKSKEDAEKQAPIMLRTQKMLQDWENGDEGVLQLWRTMNGWVYEGFDETYRKIGSDFDRTFYESDTYLLGKDFVANGLQNKVLYQKEDGSVWIDLSDVNLDQKLLLRGDGTSVYMTQDIGLANLKFADFDLDKSIYVIGDEQLHHMKVLKEIVRKLGMPFADDIIHLSYGMVELTSGKMKSREGTVVDADDLVQEMIDTAAQHTRELGKVKDFTEEELIALYEVLGLGAMKFYLLRVEPKKRMVFDPKESIDFHGFTGPFVQYTYARIQSIMRKVAKPAMDQQLNEIELAPLERELILYLEKWESILKEAAKELNPSIIANYIFNLARLFNTFYSNHSVMNAESEAHQILRLRISVMVANMIQYGLQLMGIKVPERM